VTGADTDQVAALLAEQQIRNLLLTYCRAIDRRDFDTVLNCYHPDARDDHGAFRGSPVEFTEFCRSWLPQFERTMHFVGNLLVTVEGNRAQSETYTIAFHRIAEREGRPARDHVVALRYVDRLERRAQEWRISDRTCVFEWTRTDPVTPGWDFTPEFVRGVPGPTDFMMVNGLG
jgi:ketosteroid isomerase-like protein